MLLTTLTCFLLLFKVNNKDAKAFCLFFFLPFALVSLLVFFILLHLDLFSDFSCIFSVGERWTAYLTFTAGYYTTMCLTPNHTNKQKNLMHVIFYLCWSGVKSESEKLLMSIEKLFCYSCSTCMLMELCRGYLFTVSSSNVNSNK